jgi:CBS domain-containing protein
MPEFPLDKPPFQDLPPPLRSLLQATVQRLHFNAGDPVLTPEMTPEHLVVIESGQVELRIQSQPVAVLGPGEIFGARAVLSGRCNETWMALDEVRAWGLPRATLQTLVGTHAGFCVWLFSTIAKRLAGAPASDKPREVPALTRTCVEDTLAREPFYVDGHQSLVAGCGLMHQAGHRRALVRDGNAIVGMLSQLEPEGGDSYSKHGRAVPVRQALARLWRLVVREK